LAGQKEYEVELQFSSGILNVPDRIKAAEDVTFDGEKVPLIHNDDDLDNISNEQGRDSPTPGSTSAGIFFYIRAVCGSLKQGVTNPKELLNNGRETVLEESITSASGLRNKGFITRVPH